MSGTPRIGSAVALGAGWSAALGHAWESAAAPLGGEPPDLVVVFASPEHAGEAEDIADELARRAPGAAVFGCCAADGVIGGAREHEEGPALALWLARLGPEAAVAPFALVAQQEGDGISVVGWPELDALPEPRLLLAVADPYTFPTEGLLAEVGEVPVVGGLAGLGGAGEARLFGPEGVAREGAVGVALGGVDVAPLVSQGARPLGPELVVTAAEGNAVLELAGRPALDKLREVIAELDPADAALAVRGLMVGLVIDENQAEHEMGDFLVRGLVGIDEATGALLVGDVPRVGQMARFHVRDERSADEELRSVLATGATGPVAGALLFSCNGRGSRMFSTPDHDARLLHDGLAGAPVAGMFCQGEIGPVAGRPFLHGFTATMAVFRGER